MGFIAQSIYGMGGGVVKPWWRFGGKGVGPETLIQN